MLASICCITIQAPISATDRLNKDSGLSSQVRSILETMKRQFISPAIEGDKTYLKLHNKVKKLMDNFEKTYPNFYTQTYIEGDSHYNRLKQDVCNMLVYSYSSLPDVVHLEQSEGCPQYYYKNKLKRLLTGIVQSNDKELQKKALHESLQFFDSWPLKISDPKMFESDISTDNVIGLISYLVLKEKPECIVLQSIIGCQGIEKIIYKTDWEGKSLLYWAIDCYDYNMSDSSNKYYFCDFYRYPNYMAPTVVLMNAGYVPSDKELKYLQQQNKYNEYKKSLIKLIRNNQPSRVQQVIKDQCKQSGYNKSLPSAIVHSILTYVLFLRAKN